MASPQYWPEPVTPAQREQSPMSLLPDLTPEERAELRRIKQETRERDQRFTAALAMAEAKQREALAVIERLKQELRFPLESVRVGDES